MTVKGLKHLLRKNINMCYRGAFVWHKLLKKNPEIGNTAVIILPNSDDDCAYYAMLYIDEFLDSSGFDNAVILTGDKRIEKVSEMFSQRIISVISARHKQIRLLLKYYSLYEFDRRMIVASLDLPKGRRGSSLIGLKGLTKEEVFVIGVYRLYPFKKKMPLKWDSTGSCLDRLMNRKG